MIASLRAVCSAGASPTEAPPRHVGPYRGLGALLPKRKRPGWIGQIGDGKAKGALTPAAAKAQGEMKRKRARKSLDIRGVPGFMAALRPSTPRAGARHD